jgi:hypothetical protein
MTNPTASTDGTADRSRLATRLCMANWHFRLQKIKLVALLPHEHCETPANREDSVHETVLRLIAHKGDEKERFVFPPGPGSTLLL